ncbi:MAG TPA: glutathione S-transferase N-terminal domain-containing protein, partial [Beijerinckiaceae bacterium]|nr:glutathione S-transferase N-terminal domain-containing protein [Beijerinckiaceae bacterium]
MKLYYASGACSLAPHIVAREAGLKIDLDKLDFATGKTESGETFAEVNPKGYVPALELDDGQLLTENIAILSWVADKDPSLGLSGPMGRYRLLEMLAFISTEIHKAFKPFFNPEAVQAEKSGAMQTLHKRFGFIAGQIRGDYLFGPQFTV